MEDIKFTLVSLKDPCTSCLIIDGLVKGDLEKVSNEYSNVVVETIILENLKDAANIEGLEVEKFPAVFFNGEQITAGSLITKKQFISLIKIA